MQGKLKVFVVFALACLFLIGTQTIASAQGRGHGGGRGAGHMGGGPPSGVGVDRGIGISSERSRGRADRGRDTASERSVGRSDAGLERARLQRENARRADDELRDHPGMAGRLHTTANDLRAGYQAALATNPDLKFGQYVAATRLAANLGARHPNITRGAILAGLAEGRSIGQTLHDLGLSERESKEAKKRVEREIKEAKQ
jgi:hypothetical protein